ncbi:MAG: LysM peptidoglycan-binding domain-containing protein [Chloroflexi bacterium]|nr:LysM peptidoglycan-binding domain-containing protein [Chloroflexota bacterium]
MKKLHLALIMAVMISGLFIGQVSAAASPSEAAKSVCGKAYTVVGGDTLTKIASKCGTTVESILDMNPSITDVNLIYSGMVIKLAGTTSVSPSSSSTTSYFGNAYITLATDYREYPGASIIVRAYSFPAKTTLKIGLYQYGSSTARKVYDVKTNSGGYANKSVSIPLSVSDGEKYVIKVTTSGEQYFTSVTSSIITIIGKSDDDDVIDKNYPDAEVTLSRNSVKAGETVTVYVRDFPENASIDYCVRKGSNSPCQRVYYGFTDGYGYAQLNITIPLSAKSGDYWTILVKTLYLPDRVFDLSPRITIK